MRIAIATDQYLPMISGLVDSVDTLARTLCAQGHEVRIYAPRLPGAPVDPYVFYFPSWALPGSGGGVILNFPFGALRDMRAFKPDVIHTHLFGMAGFLAWRASRKLGVPLVGTDHTSPADYLHYFYLNFQPFIFLVRRFASWFYSRCVVVSAPGEHILDELYDYGLKTKHREVIPNPISSDVFRPLGSKAELKKKYGIGERAVLIFGRIAVEKNLDISIDIYKELVTKHNNTELVLIGSGPYEKVLKEKIKKEGIGSKTKWLGILRGEALVEAINACDVMLVTSTSEVQSMTVLQAMACGVPVVAARAGGLPALVIDGDTGYLVDPKDKQTFVKKINELFDDKILRNNFGIAAREIVSQYSPEAVAKRFIALYQKAIEFSK